MDRLEEHEEEARREEEVDGDGEDPAEALVAVVDAGRNEAEVSAKEGNLHVLEKKRRGSSFLGKSRGRGATKTLQ